MTTIYGISTTQTKAIGSPILKWRLLLWQSLGTYTQTSPFHLLLICSMPFIMKATALPENMLPDLSGPLPAEPSYDPWPVAPPEATVETPPAAEAAPPVKKPRKPRAKKPAATGEAA